MSTSNNISRNHPRRVYKALFKYFGPQGWWPVTGKGEKFPVYREAEYTGKTSSEKFEICAGAILTQNTSWKNVEKALANLHREKPVSPEGLSSMRLSRLAALIRPSGYYNQKAVRLKGFSRYICGNYSGRIEKLLSKPVKELRAELLSLNGIGPETADSIILFAAEKPEFVVDAYTLRLGLRLGWFGDKTRYDEAKAYLTAGLPRSLKIYNEFHALIVAHGKEFCVKRPLCGRCPLCGGCAYEKEH